MPGWVIMKQQGESSPSGIQRDGFDHLGRTCLDEVLYYYDLMPHARDTYAELHGCTLSIYDWLGPNFPLCLIRQFRSSTNFHQTTQELLIHLQKQMF